MENNISNIDYINLETHNEKESYSNPRQRLINSMNDTNFIKYFLC